MAERELRITPPSRPYFFSLKKAVELLIENGNTIHNLNLPRVAETYACAVEDVTAEFDRQLTLKSLEPSNQYEVDGK